MEISGSNFKITVAQLFLLIETKRTKIFTALGKILIRDEREDATRSIYGDGSKASKGVVQ